MNDITIQKIMEKMRDRIEIDLKQFREELSWIRFTKKDANLILKEMKRIGLIELIKNNNGVKIIFKNKNKGIIKSISTLYCIFALLLFYMAYLMVISL